MELGPKIRFGVNAVEVVLQDLTHSLASNLEFLKHIPSYQL